MSARSLLELIEERIAAGQVELPPANRIAQQLQAVTADPDFEMNKVIALIGADQALTADILRAANSAYYGGLATITTVRGATVRLGAPEVVRLAVLATEKSQYRVRHATLGAFIPDLWHHATAVALGARWLARKLGYDNLEHEAFIGGLLHDVGNLLLVRVIDDIAAAGELQIALSRPLVAEILDSGHTRHGYLLAKHWNLPEAYCEIVRDHHAEDLSGAGALINVVALADKAATQLGIGLDHDPSLRLDATEEAHTLGASDVALAELSILLEDSAALV
jgi:HD-like signal output (HDOD) protein